MNKEMILLKKNKMLSFEISLKNKNNIDKIFKESVEWINNNIEKGTYNLNDDSCGVKLCNNKKTFDIDEFEIDEYTESNIKTKKKKCCH